MDTFEPERRGLFDGLKVPFDLHMLLLGFLAVVLFRLGIEGIELFFSQPEILARLLHPLEGFSVYTDPVLGIFHDLLGTGASRGEVVQALEAWGESTTDPWSLPLGVYVSVGVWALALWAFFSGAINRIAAMKIAREEGLELREALAFARDKFISNATSILFVGILVALFYGFFNATVAGWIGAIPWLGDILLGVLFFLVLLSTFFVVATVALGIFGHNMVSSAIAAESSDIVDGISRAWNYILFRPWQVLLYFGLATVYLCLFLAFAGLFVQWNVDSLSVGWWGLGDGYSVVDAELETNERDGLDTRVASYAGDDAEDVERVAVPRKGAYIRGFVAGRFTWDEAVFGASRPEENGDDGTEDFVNVVPSRGPPVDVAPMIPTNYKVSATMVCGWMWLIRYLILGYVVSYIFGTNTLMYFLLRKDVEGEDYSEIVIEEEMWAEDFGEADFMAPDAADEAGEAEGGAPTATQEEAESAEEAEEEEKAAEDEEVAEDEEETAEDEEEEASAEEDESDEDLPELPEEPNSITKRELKEIADAHGIEYSSSILKADLIELLEEELRGE